MVVVKWGDKNIRDGGSLEHYSRVEIHLSPSFDSNEVDEIFVGLSEEQFDTT